MDPHRRPHQRKQPQQQRSQAMVRRILDGGARVLERHGYAGASTNKIAAEAGVSPGSLYYYFPDKDAVVRLVLERFLVELTTMLNRPLGALRHDSRSMFEDYANAAIDVLEQNRRLLDVLVNEVPRLGPAHSREVLDQKLLDRLRLAFTMIGSPFDGDEFEARCWAAAQLCLTLPVRYVLAGPSFSRGRFVATLGDLLGALAGVGDLSPNEGVPLGTM
ncbi:DNA-binding transcriptional regulator, AcrR family [Actinokineospora alba]|uniref:DNA-binding transcriptional regulator, AcrR family n=1 Tax=Actinokineospora alba TaxID=504798 RepID=A0A1H0NG88_9PSEU|nr:TetR/AcrR family transcriptional regulator [Actinokineospora alba]TDP68709.1 TetR family transcriptional regulator [Actinokineospora alba]SDH84987.1 DNA-binding transcriptional regulator, AcrR family [Actinokineospora alba]SDO91693.1 DNA-binding transcriptional regulator, AcrR family [Actinokineospora alba]